MIFFLFLKKKYSIVIELKFWITRLKLKFVPLVRRCSFEMLWIFSKEMQRKDCSHTSPSLKCHENHPVAATPKKWNVRCMCNGTTSRVMKKILGPWPKFLLIFSDLLLPCSYQNWNISHPPSKKCGAKVHGPLVLPFFCQCKPIYACGIPTQWHFLFRNAPEQETMATEGHRLEGSTFLLNEMAGCQSPIWLWMLQNFGEFDLNPECLFLQARMLMIVVRDTKQKEKNV